MLCMTFVAPPPGLTESIQLILRSTPNKFHSTGTGEPATLPDNRDQML